jgi:hypothetical protein
MPDADGLRLRAIRYLAMAFKAREDGEADFAKRLAERATELLKEAATLANCSTPELEAPPNPTAPAVKVRWSQAARGEHRSWPRAGSWAVSLVVVHRYPSCSHGTCGQAATAVIGSRFSHFSTHDLIPSGRESR